MSLIVGYIDEKNKMYYIAGDSAITLSEYTKNTLSNNKVFRAKDHPEILVGVVGDFKYVGLFANAPLFDGYDPNFTKQDEQVFMADVVSRRMHKCIRDDDRFNLNGEKPQFQMLVVTKNAIYDLDNDFSAATYTDPWASIGSGWFCASTALYAMQNYEAQIPVKLTIAIYGTSKYITGISAPIDILSEPFEFSDATKKKRVDATINEKVTLTDNLD